MYPFTIALGFRNSGNFVDDVVDREKGVPYTEYLNGLQVEMHGRYGRCWRAIAVSTTCSIPVPLAQNSW